MNYIDVSEIQKSKEYWEYITSPEWQAKCDERFKIDGYTCQCCGCRGTNQNPLQVHHLHYGNFKDENVYRDLITLCKSCHEGQHNILRRITDKDGGRMWDKNGHIPLVHICTYSGIDRSRIEEPRNEKEGR